MTFQIHSKKHGTKTVTVDDSDWHLVSQHKWSLRKGNVDSLHFYAITSIKQPNGKLKHIQMHRMLMNPTVHEMVDHSDMNGLNNSRSNLRIATRAQNGWNRRKPKHNKSGYKGVTWNIYHNKWLAKITYNKKEIFLGYFDDVVHAHEAYVRASEKYHGDFSRIE